MSNYTQKITLLSTSSKYTKWYVNLIESRLTRTQNFNSKEAARQHVKKMLGCIEAHHILPKSLCSDSSQKTDYTNLVYLTPREHFIAHLLLSKMFTSKNNVKMKLALGKFVQNNKSQRRTLTSRQYDTVRKAISDARKGQVGTRLGKKASLETRKKLSMSKKGKKPPNFLLWNQSAKNKVYLCKNNEEIRVDISEISKYLADGYTKGRMRVFCKCGYDAGKSNFTRYHKNCSLK